jgi:futalosine hydrolase
VQPRGTADRLNIVHSTAPGGAPLAGILVVAATEHELAPSEGWRTLRCGVGPVDAAIATAAAIAAQRPEAIVHVGIAGARRASGLVPPAVVVGIATRYCDLDVPERFAPHHLTPPPALVEAACRAVPAATAAVIGTSGRVGRTTDCPVEAMEGFAVLRAAALAGVPAIEVRVISNAIEDTDRALWKFDQAFAAVRAITPALVLEIAACER